MAAHQALHPPTAGCAALRAQGGMHPRRTVSPLMLGMDPLHVVEELPVGLEADRALSGRDRQP
jgi:hypothetical protein